MRLEEKLLEELKRQAKAEHRNMSELIRSILVDYLKRNRWQTNQQEIEEKNGKENL